MNSITRAGRKLKKQDEIDQVRNTLTSGYQNYLQQKQAQARRSNNTGQQFQNTYGSGLTGDNGITQDIVNPQNAQVGMGNAQWQQYQQMAQQYQQQRDFANAQAGTTRQQTQAALGSTLRAQGLDASSSALQSSLIGAYNNYQSEVSQNNALANEQTNELQLNLRDQYETAFENDFNNKLELVQDADDYNMLKESIEKSSLSQDKKDSLMQTLTLNSKTNGVEIPTGETTTDGTTTSNLITATTADEFYNQTNIKLDNFGVGFGTSKANYNTIVDNIYSGTTTTDELYKLMKATVTPETMSSNASKPKYIVDKLVYMATGVAETKDKKLTEIEWNNLSNKTKEILTELGYAKSNKDKYYHIYNIDDKTFASAAAKIIQEYLSSNFQKIK